MTKPDLSEFEALTHGGQHCKTCAILEKLPAEQRTKVQAALRRPDIGADAISTVLTRWGYPVGDGAVRHHRRLHLD